MQCTEQSIQEKGNSENNVALHLTLFFSVHEIHTRTPKTPTIFPRTIVNDFFLFILPISHLRLIFVHICHCLHFAHLSGGCECVRERKRKKERESVGVSFFR